MGKNAFLSFLVPPFFGTLLFPLFGQNHEKQVKERRKGGKTAEKMWKEATRPFFPFPNSRIWRDSVFYII